MLHPSRSVLDSCKRLLSGSCRLQAFQNTQDLLDSIDDGARALILPVFAGRFNGFELLQQKIGYSDIAGIPTVLISDCKSLKSSEYMETLSYMSVRYVIEPSQITSQLKSRIAELCR